MWECVSFWVPGSKYGGVGDNPSSPEEASLSKGAFLCAHLIYKSPGSFYMRKDPADPEGGIYK